jgi:hypothetical protein
VPTELQGPQGNPSTDSGVVTIPREWEKRPRNHTTKRVKIHQVHREDGGPAPTQGRYTTSTSADPAPRQHTTEGHGQPWLGPLSPLPKAGTTNEGRRKPETAKNGSQGPTRTQQTLDQTEVFHSQGTAEVRVKAQVPRLDRQVSSTRDCSHPRIDHMPGSGVLDVRRLNAHTVLRTRHIVKKGRT